MLQVQPVSRRKLQLVGVTAMLVACKYEEMYAPEVGDFAYITDNAFTKAQILEMEQVVLKTLKFELGRPLPLHFLRRASKVASVSFGLTSECGLKSFSICSSAVNMLACRVSPCSTCYLNTSERCMLLFLICKFACRFTRDL